MIKDKLEFADNYYNISNALKIGLEWLKNNDLKSIEQGRYILDNNTDIYANVQVYNTKTDADFEGHKKYIDIQYIAYGAERIGVTNVSKCTLKNNYNEEKDIEFYYSDADASYHDLNEGEFMVLFPNDIHKPSISMQKEITVKKIVVKVPVN